MQSSFLNFNYILYLLDGIILHRTKSVKFGGATGRDGRGEWGV